MGEKRHYFYDEIFNNIEHKIKKVVVVDHAVDDVEDFILSLDKNIGVALWIPKNSSCREDVVERLKTKIPILKIKKNDVSKSNFIMYLQSVIGDETFAIIDVGGYFSDSLLELQSVFGIQLKGIVEDTENGLNKYTRAIKEIRECNKSIEFPIVSVARSSLKSSEDYVVGRDICLKTQIYFSKHRKNVFDSNIVVLGFGKIGRSVAEAFRRQGSYVSVRDINPIRQALAVNYGYKIARENYLNSADIVICATGNKSVSLDDMQKIKNRTVYFVSVTSPDDEYYNYNDIVEAGKLISGDRIVKNDNKGKAIVVHDGLAINFQETKPILDKSVWLVMGEMCRAVCSLDDFPRNTISEIPEEERMIIANYWLESISKTNGA